VRSPTPGRTPISTRTPEALPTPIIIRPGQPTTGRPTLRPTPPTRPRAIPTPLNR
jgi:hypothetical protein